MAEPKTVPLDPDYLKRIGRGLNAALEASEAESFDPATGRIAIFSDHHKGVGDPADDFRRCEHAYTAALGYYLEAGYRLFVLGDCEELWEEHAKRVVERYADVLALEGAFAERGNGLVRFYGNHDDQWGSQRDVDKHLRPRFGDIKVRQSLRLVVERPGRKDVTLFFAHGHQGTKDSEERRWLSRLVVRHVWRPLQRRLGYSATTPARSWELRAKHDRAMLEWARDQTALVMIAGHTHRPVFSTPDPPRQRPVEELERAVDEARAAGDTARAAALRVELEHARTAVRRPDRVLTVEPPCYFNTGCCSFPDGDVTGLEIADGEIRLVRWPGNLDEVRQDDTIDVAKRVLDSRPLEEVFTAVADRPPAEAEAVEHRILPVS